MNKNWEIYPWIDWESGFLRRSLSLSMPGLLLKFSLQPFELSHLYSLLTLLLLLLHPSARWLTGQFVMCLVQGFQMKARPERWRQIIEDDSVNSLKKDLIGGVMLMMMANDDFTTALSRFLTHLALRVVASGSWVTELKLRPSGIWTATWYVFESIGAQSLLANLVSCKKILQVDLKFSLRRLLVTFIKQRRAVESIYNVMVLSLLVTLRGVLCCVERKCCLLLGVHVVTMDSIKDEEAKWIFFLVEGRRILECFSSETMSNRSPLRDVPVKERLLYRTVKLGSFPSHSNTSPSHLDC